MEGYPRRWNSIYRGMGYQAAWSCNGAEYLADLGVQGAQREVGPFPQDFVYHSEGLWPYCEGEQRVRVCYRQRTPAAGWSMAVKWAVGQTVGRRQRGAEGLQFC
jgi:hypothetical protein